MAGQCARSGYSAVRRLGRAAVVAVVGVAVLGAPAAAHPLGNFTVNRFSGLEISTSTVLVHYAVDMAEIPTFQELRAIDSNGDASAGATELEDYARGLALSLLEGVSLTSGGAPVELTVEEAGAALRPGQGGLDVLRVDAVFAGELPAAAASLVYRDTNYTNPDKLGWKEVIAYPVGGQGIVTSSVPASSVSDGLRSYPQDLLSTPVEVTSAKVEVAPGAGGGGEGAGAGLEEGVGSPGALIGGSFASLVERELSPLAFVVAMGLALGFGALHALGPGHGKTVMAAYLVGADGRVRDAVIVGISVSAMHTASVVALGLVTLAASSVFPPEAVFPWLSLAAGVVVLALGAWLLWVRGRAYAQHRRAHSGIEVARPPHRGRERLDEHDHGHDDHDHHHGHDHVHDHDHAGRAAGEELTHSHGGVTHSHVLPDAPLWSWKGLAAVALAGGLLPSPTALVVLLGAVALHRVAFGIALVAGFSIGLAAALTAIGILVLRARSFTTNRLGERAGVALPILSAAAIVAVGLYLTARALSSF